MTAPISLSTSKSPRTDSFLKERPGIKGRNLEVKKKTQVSINIYIDIYTLINVYTIYTLIYMNINIYTLIYTHIYLSAYLSIINGMRAI